MWAMMPMLRIFSSGTVRGIKTLYLPAVVGKSLVGFGHSMNVVLFLNRATPEVGRVVQFVRQLLRHALLRTGTGVNQDPADRQAGAPVIGHLDRHLIVRAADAP